MDAIPIYQPSLTGREHEYVLECLDTGWISSKGPFVTRFETRFAEFIDVRHATSVCNGTVGLHLALVALGLGPGDEVLVPTLTYIASVNAIAYTGATPVFVDSMADTWQMDPLDVERKISPRTRAIMAVHVYGHPVDMTAISRLALKHRLFVVEDCAEAIGSRCAGRHVGTFGDIGVFSFYGNKTVTTGEGGMVVTNDETLFARMVHFKGQGLAAHRQYWHDVIGYNYRMTNICAAIGLAQMEQVGQFLARKRKIAERYREKLSGRVTVHDEKAGFVHSYWMCSVLVDKPQLRDPLRAHLSALGIETRPTFYPVHTMPMYAGKYERHMIAEDIGWRGINIPSWPGLTDVQVDLICASIIKFVEENKAV
jgi:perosamine synthetase